MTQTDISDISWLLLTLVFFQSLSLCSSVHDFMHFSPFSTRRVPQYTFEKEKKLEEIFKLKTIILFNYCAIQSRDALHYIIQQPTGLEVRELICWTKTINSSEEWKNSFSFLVAVASWQSITLQDTILAPSFFYSDNRESWILSRELRLADRVMSCRWWNVRLLVTFWILVIDNFQNNFYSHCKA